MNLNGVALLMISASIAAAADPSADNPSGLPTRWDTKQWTTEDGLPANGIKGIAQTPDGYLWVGTLNGLARFDGNAFTIYSCGNTPRLISDAINSLATDLDGTLWMGTAGGLVGCRHGVVQQWASKEGLPGKSVYSLVGSRAGGVWWREGDWCGLLKEGRVRRYGEEHGMAAAKVWSLAPAVDGSLLVFTRDGFQRTTDPSGERFSKLVSWPAPGSDWQGREDSAGRLWASANAGTFRYETNHWVALSATNGFEPNIRFFGEKSGRWWMASQKSGLRWLQTNDLPSEPVLKPDGKGFSVLFEDREGNVWVGAGDGLYRLRPQRIRTWTTQDELPSNKVRSISAGPDGSVWAGTEGGLARIRAGRVDSFSGAETNAEFGMAPVWAERNGAVWGFKRGVTLLRFDGRKFEPRPVFAEAPNRDVNSFCEDRLGRLCIGIDHGVSVHANGRFLRLFPSTVVGDAVFAMLNDRQGRWWLGTKTSGTKRFDPPDTKVGTPPPGSVSPGVGNRTPSAIFSTANGFSDNKVTCFHEDTDGVIWIGTANGLNRFHADRMVSFGIREGLVETIINTILEDDAGNFWLSGHRGVHRVSRAQLNAVAEGRTRRVQCVSYGEVDGMASGETNGEMQPAGCKTADGHLWFPTIKGVAEMDPRLLIGSEIPPLVLIDQVKSGGVEIWSEGCDTARLGLPAPAPAAFPQLARLDAEHGRLVEIRFAANCLSAPDRTRFKWKLEPSHEDWHDVGTQRFVFLQNLHHGSYTFRVEACNYRGVWSGAGASFAFVITPHFYETWMFYGMCAAGVLLLGLTVHYWRVSFLKRIHRLEREQALQAERARIAQDLHDNLGANLTGIALQVDLAQRQARDAEAGVGVPSQLKAVAASVRSLVDEMRATVWAMNPRHDKLESLAGFLSRETQKQTEAAGLRSRLGIADNLPDWPVPAKARHHIYLVVKEALHNAVQHAAAREVRLTFEVVGGELRASVEDDGCGIAAQSPEGNGLRNMRERMEAMGGRLTVESVSGGGTRVMMRLPASCFERARL